MGKRAKRARTLIKRMNMLGEIPNPDVARRFCIEKEVQAEIDIREAKEAEARRLVEEAERKERETEEAKRKAQQEAKRKAEEAKKKAEAAKKRKAAAAKKKAEAIKQSPEE